jgi:hypothetical protein
VFLIFDFFGDEDVEFFGISWFEDECDKDIDQS